MACCNNVQSAEMVARMEESTQAALGFGFDTQWIADILKDYGQTVLDLVLEAMRGGFSKELVLEIISKFGPLVLEFLVNLLNRKKMAMTSGLSMTDANINDQMAAFIDISFIETIVQKYLPLIIEKYGPVIVQAILDYLLKMVQPKTA